MSELTLQPLLAADLWQTLFGLLVFILWSLGQWLGARNEAKQKQQPRVRPPAPPRLDAPQGGEPASLEEVLRGEVEDFLRKAQGKPARQPSQRVKPAVQPQSPRVQPSRPQLAPTQRPAPRSLREEGVAEHVSRHLNTSEMAEHTRSLGATVATSDDRLESHLHEKFDQALGSLGQRDQPSGATGGPEASEAGGQLAEEIAQLLATPQGMRQLIVANEILRRPEW